MFDVDSGSGSGQHISHLAQNFPNIEFQPSDIDQRLFTSIDGYTKAMNLKNVLPPIHLDVSDGIERWPISTSNLLDIIICINVIHISPWKCTEGLFRGTSLLADNGLLITYGPYASDGVLTPESNINFDRNLRQQDPEWGVRDIKDLKVLSQWNGLTFVSMFEMPANNKVLVFKKVS